MGYDEVRIMCRPDVTVNSGPVPYVGPELIVENGSPYPPPVIDGDLTDAIWTHAPHFDIRYGDDVLRQTYPGVLRWRASQFQPTVNGGQAFVQDPGDATVSYFFRDDSLYFGFNVRDQHVQSYPITDRMDGFVVGIYDRTAREQFDSTLQPHRLTFDVSPTGTARTADYLTTLVNNGGARIKLKLKPGTVLDTTGTQGLDTGYTAELVIDLTKIGYPHGRGDGLVFFNIDMYDGDSFTPFTDSYGTRTWWGSEYENTCCPPWAYMDPFEVVLAGVGDAPPGIADAMLGVAPNPFRSGTLLRYRLSAPANVLLYLYDPQGRVVAGSDVGVQAAGEQSAPIVGFKGGTGVYLYRIRLSDPATGALRGSLSGRVLAVR